MPSDGKLKSVLKVQRKAEKSLKKDADQTTSNTLDSASKSSLINPNMVATSYEFQAHLAQRSNSQSFGHYVYTVSSYAIYFIVKSVNLNTKIM